MATSQNGYLVHVDQSQLAVLPWVTGRVLPGDVWMVLDYLCRRYHAEVEPIRKDWSWGYAYRAIRGQTSGYSNHASGTAIDLNAPKHPLGSRGTFTAAQVRALRHILNDLGGAIRWGGDYQRRPDEMHFEIDATPRRIAEVAANIRAGKLGGIRPAPGLPGTGVNNTPKPAPASTPDPIDPLEEIMSWYKDREDFERSLESRMWFRPINPDYKGDDPALQASRNNALFYVAARSGTGQQKAVAAVISAELAARPNATADEIADAIAAKLVDGIDVELTVKRTEG